MESLTGTRSSCCMNMCSIRTNPECERKVKRKLMLRRISLIFLVLSLTLLFHSTAHVQTSGGTIQGRILYSGEPPRPSLISMAKDPNCLKINAGKKTFEDSLVVSPSRQIKNAFIHLKAGLAKKSYPATTPPPSLDQKGCSYSPRVQGAV